MEHIESVDVNEDQALYTIEEKPVLVIDGIFDEDTLRGWVDFYQYKPFYNNGVIYNRDGSGTEAVGFNSNFELDDYFNIFPIQKVISYVQKLVPQVSIKNIYRSYINAVKENQSSSGHYDYQNPKNDEFYFVALWFGNPTWDYKDGGAISFGEELQLTIQNVFNRMIIFDATLLHKIELHKSKLTRLTTYMAFTNTQKGFLNIQGANRW